MTSLSFPHHAASHSAQTAEESSDQKELNVSLGCVSRTTAIITDMSLEWTSLLPAWDSAQESSESCSMFFLPVKVIDLPSWFVKIN